MEISLLFDIKIINDMFYGNKIRKYVFSILKKLKSNEYPLRFGNMLFYDFAYQYTSTKKENKISQYLMEPNYSLADSLCLEFYNQCIYNGSIFYPDFYPKILIEKELYSISIGNLSESQFKKLTKCINNKALIAIIIIDKENPLLYDPLINFLFDGLIYSKPLLKYKSEDIICHVKEELPKFTKIKIMTDKDIIFCDDIWKTNKSSPNIRTIAKIYKQKSNHTHSILNDIIKSQMTNNIKNTDFEYDIDQDFSIDKIYIDDRKIKGYILNLQHKDGKDKAIRFKNELNITLDDSDFLKSQFLYGLLNSKAVGVKKDQYGYKYSCNIQIKGRNNAIRTVKTAWIRREDKNIYLTTAFILKTKDRKIFDEGFGDIYIDRNEENYFDKLIELASIKSYNASFEYIPTPIFLDNNFIIEDGVSGNAYLEIKLNTDFGTWLYNKYNPSKEDTTIMKIQHPGKTDSFEKKLIYAETFYTILKINNIESNIIKDVETFI